MTNGNRTKLLVFLLVAVGGWAQTLPNWYTAVTPDAVSGLLIILGSSLGLAFGVDTNGAASGLVRKLTGSGSTPVPKPPAE